MRSLKGKPRLIAALAAFSLVFICGFISLAFRGSNPTTSTISNSGLTNTPSPTGTAMPTMTAMAMMAMIPTATMYVADTGYGGANYSQVSAVQSPSEQEQIQPGQRIVIRNATLSITVEDTEARVNDIASMATGLGGWVVSSTTSVSGGTPEHPYVYGNIVVRIPAESLDPALETIRAMASVINNEQITGQDVTQDYVDTSSQLRNLEAAEQQLQTIMLSATTVDDVLNVYNQLVQTRSQIEVARGRLQYFDQASAFSSITISLSPIPLPATPTPTPTPIPASAGWNPLVTANRALDSLVRTSQSGVDFLITWGVYGLPIVLIFGLPSFLLFRQLRQKRSTKRMTVIENTSSTSDGENA